MLKMLDFIIKIALDKKNSILYILSADGRKPVGKFGPTIQWGLIHFMPIR